MLSTIKSKVIQVIKLAEELNRLREEKYEKYGNHVGQDNFKEIYEDKTTAVARKNIVSYLQSLTDDEVLAIQAIMYLGRDQDYNNSFPPEEILKQQMSSLGFKTKDIEINQIVQKVPLPKYLYNGLEILKLV